MICLFSAAFSISPSKKALIVNVLGSYVCTVSEYILKEFLKLTHSMEGLIIFWFLEIFVIFSQTFLKKILNIPFFKANLVNLCFLYPQDTYNILYKPNIYWLYWVGQVSSFKWTEGKIFLPEVILI